MGLAPQSIHEALVPGENCPDEYDIRLAWYWQRTHRDRQRNDQRTQVLRLRRMGQSFTAIGERLGISRQYARDLYLAETEAVA